MADDEGAAGELQQGVLERAQGVHVEVVGRLVEQQDVGAGLDHLGQVDPVALAARELADLFLLVAALEVEGPDIGPRGRLVLAQGHGVAALGDLLPDRLVRGQRIARLVDIAELDRLAQAQAAAVRLLLARDHAEQRGLAGAVRPDDADDGIGRDLEAQVVDQQALAEALAQVLGLDHEVAEPRPRRDDDLAGLRRLAAGLGQHGLVGLDARLGLGLARLGALADPFQLVLELALARRFGLFLLAQAGLLLLQPGGVVALEGDAVAAVELQDPARHVVQEIAVVGHGHHGARILVQEALQPGHGLGVQVVGRLVEQQHVRLLQEQAAERDPAPLAARERRDLRVAGRAAQGVHGDLDRALQVPGIGGLDPLLQLGLLGHEGVEVGVLLGEAGVDRLEAVEQVLGLGHALVDIAGHVALGVKLGLLRQVADAHALGGPGLAVDLAVQPGHDPHEGRLAGPVQAQDADLGAGQEAQVDVLEHLLAAGKGLGDPAHVIDVLIRGHILCPCARGIPPWGVPPYGPGFYRTRAADAKPRRRRDLPRHPPLTAPAAPGRNWTSKPAQRAGLSGESSNRSACAQDAAKGGLPPGARRAKGGGPGRIRTCDNTVMSGGF